MMDAKRHHVGIAPLVRRMLGQVRKLEQLFSSGHVHQRADTDYWLAPSQFRKGRWRIAHRDDPERIAFVERQDAEACLAEARRICQNRVEDSCKLAKRTAHQMQNFGGRGLLL